MPREAARRAQGGAAFCLARILCGALAPGGRLLNHGITRLMHYGHSEGDFTLRFVFPDGKLLHLERIVGAPAGGKVA